MRRAVWPIREQIPEGLPTVFADPNRLQQVLDNLLENAVYYVEAPGTVQVRVEAQQDGVLLSVEDTGPGIPAVALHTSLIASTGWSNPGVARAVAAASSTTPSVRFMESATTFNFQNHCNLVLELSTCSPHSLHISSLQ